MKFYLYSLVAAILLPSFAAAQLSGSVGPLTTRASKRSKVCNVLNYGGVASKTSDIGPPLASAFAACKTGGTGEFFEVSILNLSSERSSLRSARRLWHVNVGYFGRRVSLGSST